MTYSLTLLRHAEKKEYSLLYEKKQKLMLLLGNPTNRLQVQHHIARSVCWIQWILLKMSLNGGVQCRNGVITIHPHNSQRQELMNSSGGSGDLQRFQNYIRGFMTLAGIFAPEMSVLYPAKRGAQNPRNQHGQSRPISRSTKDQLMAADTHP